MGFSKRQFCDAAFEEIGLARYSFDISPEQEESALKRLDSMMADWNASGLRLNYPIPGSPEFGEIDAESGVPDMANEAIITNLAIRLAPQYGRTVMPDTRATAARALNTLRARVAVIPQVKPLPDTPLGAGNRSWRFFAGPFVVPSPTQVDAGPDQRIEY